MMDSYSDDEVKDDIIIPCDPDDQEFVGDVFDCGMYKGGKDSCQNYIDFISRAEKIGLDPENILEEVKGLSATCLGFYDRSLNRAKERISNEY